MTQRIFRDLFSKERVVVERNTKSYDKSWRQRPAKQGE